MAAPLLPSFLTVTARRRKLEIAWIATILLSGSLGVARGGSPKKTIRSGRHDESKRGRQQLHVRI